MLFFSEATPLTEVPLSPKPIYQGQWSPRLPHPHHKAQKSPLKIALVGGSLLAGVLLLSWQLHAPSASRSEAETASPSRLSALSSYFRPTAPPPSSFSSPPSTPPSASFTSTASATASCDPCLLDPSDPLCVYGTDNIRLSRAFEGSGHRVRRVLEKALRGERVRIGVLGASVTAGHGLNGQQKWQDRFFEDFVKIFPNSEIYDGAASGMNSEFVGGLEGSAELIRPWAHFSAGALTALYHGTLTCIYLSWMIDDTFAYDDTLFRGLLGLPQEPAVIRVSVFALAFEDLARGLVSSLVMSNFFDVPIISLWWEFRRLTAFAEVRVRNFLLPHLIANPEEVPKFFSKAWEGNPDLRHMSHLSHQAMGDMLALYMREKTCETKRRPAHPPPPSSVSSLWPSGNALGVVPRLYLWEPYSTTYRAPPVVPSCAFLASKTHPLVPLNLYPEDKEEGKEQVPDWTKEWKRVDWNGKSAWQSSQVGAEISFEVKGAKVGVFVWTTNGAGNLINPGRARCWIGEDVEGGKTVDAFGSGAAASSGFNLIAEGLPHRTHLLTCQILAETSTDGHDFRILGVAAQ
uniref:Uncharacterized protein n=1 Tax=Leucosporidium scottii TaxID=5278 RepID=A0A0H5FS64_9BASI|nr:hypothetical protein ls5930a1_00171 [Leucosporidium scottii]CRX79202.1 hypothetical protein ls5931a1_00026 [Leucosporidium scottii]